MAKEVLMIGPEETSLLTVLQKVANKLLAEEIIGGSSIADVLEFVDLDIEDSPVIPFRGGNLCHALPVQGRTKGGDYIVGDQYVSPEALTVMRARYLLTIKEQQRREYAPVLDKLRSAAPDGVQVFGSWESPS